jgi:tRNA wybutosine-synthesizing protein 4
LSRFDVSGWIPRFSHSSQLLRGDQLLVIGGTSNAQEPGIAVVDLRTKVCREFSVDQIPLEAPLTLHASNVVEEDGAVRVVIFGGGTNCFSFGMHLNKFVIEIKLDL